MRFQQQFGGHAQLAWLAVLLAVSGAASQAMAEDARPLLRQEYFIEQRANEELLVRINGFEASFQARVLAPGGELIARSGVPDSRLAPLFIYLQGRGSSRQLDIEVSAVAATGRSRFDLEINRMNVFDERSGLLARAYEMLSSGLAVPADDAPASWSVKVNSLINAGRVFEQFGMEELRLWSEYYSGLLMLRELGDNYSALAVAEGIIDDPGARRHRQPALAAWLLLTEVNGNLRAAGELPAEAGPEDPLQAAATAASALAAELDQLYARGWALDASARDFAQRGLQRQALDQFQVALEVADAIDAGDLGTAIREAMVEIHGRQGDLAASAEVLREIETQLNRDGGGDDLAQNLLEQGMLLNQGGDYQAAIEVLQRALEFERNSVTRDQVRLQLATALYEAGRLDEALEQAAGAVLNPATGAWRQRTPVLDVAGGIAIIAGVYRARGQFQQMRQARQAQGERLAADGRAGFSWQQVRDELSAGAAPASVAPRLQALSAQAAPGWSDLAVLQQCALGLACPPASARAAYQRLDDSGQARARAEARLLMAQWQALGGDRTAAARLLEGLLDDMLVLNRERPGALGAWYWQRLDAVLAAYIEPLMTMGTPQQALLGLARARAVMAAHAAPEGAVQAGFAADRLQALLAGLGPDEALLDVYAGPSGAWLLLADAQAVQRWRLANNGSLQRDLRSAVERAPVLNGAAFDGLMDRLGQQLLGPLPERLPTRLYWLGGDELAALPLAALRRDGRYLVEDHLLLRLTGEAAQQATGRSVVLPAAPRVFLAGRPQDYSGEYLQRLETSQELRAVTDAFVGPGLTVVQGAALLPDEFADPDFARAQLLHLAMPALLDLAHPGASHLQLSEAQRGEGRVLLGPAQVGRWSFAPLLVVFSQATVSTSPAARNGNRLPLVTDLLEHGAGMVIATLWPNEDAASAAFLRAFYARLADGAPAEQALAAAQRQVLGVASEDRNWARYQAYIHQARP